MWISPNLPENKSPFSARASGILPGTEREHIRKSVFCLFPMTCQVQTCFSIIRAALGQSPVSQVPGVNALPLLLERIASRQGNDNWSRHVAETLPFANAKTRTVRSSVILECEMVAYDEMRGKIDGTFLNSSLVFPLG
jgi:hypothetical protein